MDPKPNILINCDMGESFGKWQKGNDKEIVPYIDLANIACGFHASDPLNMVKDLTVLKAIILAVKDTLPGWVLSQSYADVQVY